MTCTSWEPRYRVTTVTPGKLDLFAVTLVNGRCTAVGAITEYEAALGKARAFVEQHDCQVKVLPVTGLELRNLLGIALPDHPQPMDAQFQQLMVETVLRVARESNDADARRDAHDLLAAMGVLTT